MAIPDVLFHLLSSQPENLARDECTNVQSPEKELLVGLVVILKRGRLPRHLNLINQVMRRRRAKKVEQELSVPPQMEIVVCNVPACYWHWYHG